MAPRHTCATGLDKSTPAERTRRGSPKDFTLLDPNWSDPIARAAANKPGRPERVRSSTTTMIHLSRREAGPDADNHPEWTSRQQGLRPPGAATSRRPAAACPARQRRRRSLSRKKTRRSPRETTTWCHYLELPLVYENRSRRRRCRPMVAREGVEGRGVGCFLGFISCTLTLEKIIASALLQSGLNLFGGTRFECMLRTVRLGGTRSDARCGTPRTQHRVCSEHAWGHVMHATNSASSQFLMSS
jgi:hypothetical protein